MNNHEVSQLLAYIAELDGRQFTPTTVQVWADVLGDEYTLAEMRAAVKDHFVNSTEFLKPGHLVARVRTARRRRLTEAVSGEVHVNPLDDPRGPDATVREFEAYKRNRREVRRAAETGALSREQYRDYLDGQVPWAEFRDRLSAPAELGQ